MASEPRIPIEIDKRPVQREGARLGCSGVALVALVTVAAFYFLYTNVTPNITKGGAKMVGDLLGGASPTPALSLNTPTPEATATPAPTDTPDPLAKTYVQVANTDGDGVKLRKDPKQDADKIRVLPEGTVVQIIGPDQNVYDDKLAKDIVWANVRTLDENSDIGWISHAYLVPASQPTP